MKAFQYPVKWLECRVKVRDSRFGRVVKAKDLKSFGVTRAGSNPAADVPFYSTHKRSKKYICIDEMSVKSLMSQ